MAKQQTLTFKALGWLLTYPDAAVVGAVPDILAALREEALLPPDQFNELARFAGTLAARDLIEAQESYVGVFDKSRQVSLHLFEHVHGESRDRGMAMINLREVYSAAGLFADETELPDFLPMYLEYLARLPLTEAKAGLKDVAPILQQIHKGLLTRESPYAIPLGNLLHLAGAKPLLTTTDVERDDTPEAIDRAWEEQAVVFGPDNDPQKSGDCGRASAMLARMNAQGAQSNTTEAQK